MRKSVFAFEVAQALCVLLMLCGCSLVWDAEPIPRPPTEADLCENGEDDDEDGNEDTGFISAFQLNAVCPGGIVATAFT